MSRLSKYIKSANAWRCFFVLLALAFVGLILYRISAPEIEVCYSPQVLAADGSMLRLALSVDDMWRIPISAEEISPALKKAVLAYEDRRFNYHLGVDPLSLMRALIANIKAGKAVQGASTISMQLARLMEPKQRTITHKFIEILRAFQLELRYSKDDILAMYFNLAPYGGNIVGVKAASYLYFNKNPKQLSLGEAALLAALPNNPNGLRPDLHQEAALRAREKVLNVLERIGQISAQQKAEALSEPLPQKRFPLPFNIPHLSTLLLEKYAGEDILNTTIDPRVQHLAEQTLKDNLKPLKRKGITNGAVVVINNVDHRVLALVGSADFFDDKIDGQVNGAMAARSPGSALKPFVYALGIENGLISPESILYDVPVEYTGYRPVNYDDCFHGVVTVRQALTRSLNVPAVNLAADLGEEGLYSFLKNAGISTLPKPKDYYGLSLILGGCGVSLLELTNLYAGLANGGVFKPYQFLQRAEFYRGEQLLTEGVCFILSEMLSELRRPELPSAWEQSVNLPKVAWKTGTSYGHRDAWSIGYTPE
ncbi:MAG: penicillin-binding protein 1C, partial [bacterium]|nr:penicillin-binding protein 1C [bacterium]